MHIIGTKASGHDQSCCYLKNGEIIYFCEEERFNRYKKSWSYTSWALRDLLSRFHIGKDEPVLYNHYHDLQKYKYEALVQQEALVGKQDAVGMKGIRGKADILVSRSITEAGFGQTNVTVTDGVEHHLLHAASAFFPSPFERAAILSIDGAGDACSTIIAHGIRNKIEIKYRIPLPHSLGNFYFFITYLLRLGGVGDEGKTMGAAPYGDWRKYYDLFRDKIIDFDDDGVFILKASSVEDISAVLKGLLADDYKTPMRPVDFDLAATTQKITEECLHNLARFARKLTGERFLCMAGGVALNSVSNGKVLQSGLFDDLWIQPIANDAGLSIGGALWNHYVVQQQERREENGKKMWAVQEHVFWGPESSDEEILRHLKEFGLPIRRIDDIEAWTARQIHANKVVGWFQGRMEAGPRSLGNRSILANPTHPDMKDIVNNKVKFRESWRPFAPSVLEEDCGVYFDSSHPSPFMILVYDVKDTWKDRLPAILHVDGTARVQTVSKTTNARYYRMIEEFKKLSGIGMVMNTSFNLKGEPIVLSPRQAIVDFLRTEMDVLVLHNFVLEKTQLSGYRTNKVRPAFDPLEENIHLLAEGSYLVLDYCGKENEPLMETLLYHAQFRHIELDIIPLVKSSEDYRPWQERFPSIHGVMDNPSATGRLSLGSLEGYRGIICLLPSDPIAMACDCLMEDITIVRSQIDQFLSAAPNLPVWMIGKSHIFTDYRDFVTVTTGLQERLAEMLDLEKKASVIPSEYHPFMLDLENRFRRSKNP